MKYQEVFGLTYARIANKSSIQWQLDFDVNQVEHLLDFYDLYEKDLALDADYQRIIKTGEAFCSDLIAQAKSNPESSAVCQFFKFAACASMADYFMQRKVTAYAKLFLDRSLDDAIDYPTNENRDISRLVGLLKSDNTLIQFRVFPTLSIWLSALYYYAWWKNPDFILAKDFIEEFGDPYLGAIRHLASSGEAFNGSTLDYNGIKAVGQMFIWLKTTKYDQWFYEYVTEVMLDIYGNPNINPEWRKEIIFKFCDFGILAGGKTYKEWCETILSEFPDRLKAHQRMLVWLDLVKHDNDLAVKHLPSISASIDEYRQYFSAELEKDKLFSYELATIYEAPYRLMINLMLSGFVNEAEEIFSRFFKIQEFSRKGCGTLHIVPDGPNGVLYLCDLLGFVNPYSKNNLLKELLDAQEGFLHLKSSDSAVQGVPVEIRAPRYEQLVREHFAIADHEELFQHCTAYFLHYTGNFPLQSIIAKSYGKCLPLASSFTIPADARPLRHMLLWQDDNPIAAEEVRGIIHMLENAAISYVLLTAIDHTTEDFKRHYESDKYDHIHISSHGNYSHSEPHTSYIQLGTGQHVPISFLQNLRTTWSGRRLLFLNICDGATTSLSNSPASLGFVPLLVRHNQSVISHLWPINQRAALVWGWLITACRLKGLSFEDAYLVSINAFCNGKEGIVSLLNVITDQTLLDRIYHLDIDFSNFVFWGSVSYLI